MRRRCPNCGGLVGPDAQWCGQCLTRFDQPSAPAARRPAATPGPSPEPAARPRPDRQDDGRRSPAGAPRAIRTGDQGIVWECPTCQSANPIESAVCPVCGTPFARLFEEESDGPTIEPGRAIRLSLLFPGIGHLAAGRGAEGLARAVVFAYALITVITILVARLGEGLGPFLPLLLISAVAGVVLYAVTAVDAGRVARAEAPVLSSRALLYGAVGLMLVTLVVLVILGTRATGRG